MELKKDDIVLVTNTRCSYSGYYKFFEENGLDIDIAARYAYFEEPKFYGIYRVLFVENSTSQGKICIEEIGIAKRIYITGKDGVTKIGELEQNYEKTLEPFFNIKLGYNKKYE